MSTGDIFSSQWYSPRMSRLKLVSASIVMLALFSETAFAENTNFVDHELVVSALANPQNKYHKLLSNVAPLVLRKMSGGGSATIFAKTADGQGLVLTALHIENSKFPQVPEMLGLNDSKDWSLELQPIRRTDKSPVESVIDTFLDPVGVTPILGGFTLHSPKADIPYNQVNSHLYPKNDFALMVLPQVAAWYWAKNSSGVPSQLDGKYSPQALTAIRSEPIGVAEPTIGSEAVLVGFPKKNTPDTRTQSILDVRNGQSYSTGQTLSDAEAMEILKTAEGAEKLIPFDRNVEFLILGKASPGFSGGGAFDLQGNYLGIIVRGGKTDDGLEFVRVVRAQYVLSQSIQKIENMTTGEKRDKTLGLIPKELQQKTKIYICKYFYR
jgi:hypothetical protein